MTRWLWLSLAVVVLDQSTKRLAELFLEHGQPQVVSSFFNLTLAYNKGAAFSFLAASGGWQRWLLLLLAVAVSAGLVLWLIRLPNGVRLLAIALALVIGGAIGNLIDRAVFGHVIDFFDFHHRSLAGLPGFNAAGHWPIFNIADCAISVGAVLLVIDALFFSGRVAVRSSG